MGDPRKVLCNGMRTYVLWRGMHIEVNKEQSCVTSDGMVHSDQRVYHILGMILFLGTSVELHNSP
jgi:hypothetical protein